jgi:hypothetical protein
MLDPRTMCTIRRATLAGGLSLSLAAALLACGAPRLPAPAYVGHPTEALQEAPYPPPPARVEYIPNEPAGGAVWIDGEWTWQGRRYAWKQGRWVNPPTSARFAIWTSTRDPSGLLYLAEGKWRDAQGRELPDPQPLALGRTRGGPVTDPEGTPVQPTQNVAPGTEPGSAKTSADAGDAGPETPTGATPTGTEPKSGSTPTPAGVEASDGGLVEAGSDASAPRMVPK